MPETFSRKWYKKSLRRNKRLRKDNEKMLQEKKKLMQRVSA